MIEWKRDDEWLTKLDGSKAIFGKSDWLVAKTDEYDMMIDKTTTYGGRKIPKAQTWTLSIMEPFYFCSCQPTRKQCMELAERFIKALPILKGEV